MIYIYALVCPITCRVRYVGKCKNVDHRLASHISKARLGQTSHHCARWISTLLEKSLTPKIKVLIKLPDDADWQFFERATIARYRRRGFDLTNLTGGGEGFHNVPSETTQRRTEAWKRWFSVPENRDRQIAAMTAGRDNAETRQKMSNRLKASWRNNKDRFLAGMRDPTAIVRRSAASKRGIMYFTNPESVVESK